MSRSFPAYRLRHLSSRTILTALAVAGALSIAADWLVHEPLATQRAVCTHLGGFLGQGALRLGNVVADMTDNLGLSGHDITVPAGEYAVPTDGVFFAGEPVRVAGGPAPDDVIVLRRKGFTAGYSPSLRHPVWVAYRTFRAPARPAPPRPGFKADPQAPRSPGVSLYAKSGYDRGHLAPNHAIAMRFGTDGQRETFLTSNICPQKPSLNRGPWYELEYRIDEVWPDCYGNVWVIVGSVPHQPPERMKGGIEVPAGFFQIIVAEKKGQIKACAVYMPQSIWFHDYSRARIVPIDAIESLTGFDFLPALPDDLENRLEAGLPTRLLPAGLFGWLKIFGVRYQRYD